MLHRLIAAAVAVAVLVIPVEALGDGVVPGAFSTAVEAPSLPPGDDRIESLSLGGRAPFEGMLLDTDTAIRWTNKLRWYQNQLRLQVSFFGEVITSVRSSGTAERHLVEASYMREVQGLRQDLRDQATRYARDLARAQQPTPWYKTFTFGMILGATGAVVLVGLTAWAISSVN